MIYILYFLVLSACIYVMYKKDDYKTVQIITLIGLSLIPLFLTKDYRIILFTPVLGYIFIKDWKEYTIPHYTNLYLFIINILVFLFNNDINRKYAITVVITSFIVLYLIYIMGQIGGGDILLIPNLIMYMNFEQILAYLYIACFIAIFIYIGKKLYKRAKFKEKVELAFGPALIIAFIIKSTLY